MPWEQLQHSSNSQIVTVRSPNDREAWLGYNLWGRKRVRHDLATKQQQEPYY